MYTAPQDPLNPPRCCRCRRVRELIDMVPLVDQYGQWDEKTYRNWCLNCWARRMGAVSPADPAFFIPRDARTKRYDKLAMGALPRSAREIREQAMGFVRGTANAFTDIHMPPSKIEKLLEIGNTRTSKFELPPDTPTAQDILDRQAGVKHNPSKVDEQRAMHTCVHDGEVRPMPEMGDYCNYCGKPHEELVNAN